MDTRDLFERLGLALAIGLLIGLERGWRERDFGDGERAAGIRTFALIGLLGGLGGAMAAPTRCEFPERWRSYRRPREHPARLFVLCRDERFTGALGSTQSPRIRLRSRPDSCN